MLLFDLEHDCWQHQYKQISPSIRLGCFVVVTALLSALKRENERVAELARADPLTGVLNIRTLRDVAAAELGRMGRSNDL